METRDNGNDVDSSSPSSPQPKKGRGIARGQKLLEDPSQKLSIGNWNGKILPKQIRKDISIILKFNMRDAYTG
ncbi:hypothetical protein SLA2020_059020 [Shorea laevis]